MRKTLSTALLLAGITASLQAAASAEETIVAQLQKVNKSIPVVSVEPAQMPGMYEVTLGSGEVLYADPKGEYFVVGQMYRYSDQDGFVNLTEKKLAAQRAEKLKQVAEEDMVIFAPEGEVKATLNVFTDVDCPYCRKLHEEVPKLNEMGVQVNYLAFPRAGFGSPAYKKMNSIWCGEPGTRTELMTKVKTGQKIEELDCKSPVMEQMALGQSVGVTGTPALLLEDGTLVPGYMPAARLGAMLGIE
ncbi:DsbC family protein [Marinobacterium arenosum]|uniref:DsbC family protein n=1 Tax=Marinobacterium arenosum TaxID=2862496 RepID=UPI001C98A681|nr:DsbC family protein [Marinobacterium arenosum]MBY4676150.1 DsbC family protein [Marinobacterium arenosum]